MISFKIFKILIWAAFIRQVVSQVDTEKKESHEHHKYPFGSNEFWLYTFYSLGSLNSHRIFCRSHVRTNSRVYLNRYFTARNKNEKWNQ